MEDSVYTNEDLVVESGKFSHKFSNNRWRLKGVFSYQPSIYCCGQTFFI